MKRHAPATMRNREAIAAVLASELRDEGTVLEIASGSGEHAIYFAGQFPSVTWQPSDPDAQALTSISAYRSEYSGQNCAEPVELDASSLDWPISAADAIVCINMVHISPWEATVGLFKGAAKLLGEGAPLILYGPYFEDGEQPAPSNLEFDQSLRARDHRWGIRQIADVDEVAQQHGFRRALRHEMPANNLTLIYRKVATN